MEWRPPDKEYELSDGWRMLAYYSARTVLTGGAVHQDSVYDYQTGTTVYVERQRPTRTHHRSRTTSFIVSPANIVVDWRFKGNDFKSSAPD